MADETTGVEAEKPTGDKVEAVENKEGGDNTPKPPDDEPEIPVRRSARDYINERRSARLAKTEAAKTPTPDDDEDEIEPAGKKAIAREVSEQVSPLVKAQQDSADEADLRQVLIDHPEFKPFEKAIRKNIAVHTSMPVLQLAYAVAGDKLMAIGAAQKAKADKDAREQNLGASTGRKSPASGEPDYANMPSADFQKEVAKAKGQRV